MSKKLCINLSCEIPEKLFKKLMKKGINPGILKDRVELCGNKLNIDRIYIDTGNDSPKTGVGK